MKKKIIGITISISLLFAGTAGAVSGYYLSEINSYKEAKKKQVQATFKERNDELEQQLYHDTVMILNREYERMDKETDAYLDQKFQEKSTKRLAENDKAIKQETDKAIKELKTYVNSLFK